MATDFSILRVNRSNVRGCHREGRIVGTPPPRCTGALRHGVGVGRQPQIILAFAIVFLIPRVILSSEPVMEIFVDCSSMAISGVSPKMVKDIAKANDFNEPDRWPVYKTTGHPKYRLPASFIRREKDHPEWDLKRLIEYQIAFRTYTDGKHEQRIVLLYRREANVLFVLYKDMPSKEKDDNSPF